ncbi:MAG: glycosyltransferase family 2 protein [Lachnospiraceae bacterium]
MKKISILTPCYNEEGNVYQMYKEIQEVMKQLPNYKYEHIFIDNCSTDNTRVILRKITEEDRKVKVIFNERNFGPNRSGSHGFFQTTGDVSICMACDFQDPPQMIPEFVKKWEDGYKVVWGKKTGSKESKAMFAIRTLYYKIVKKFADVKQYEHVTGFGLYDKQVVNLMREANEPNPSFRNLIAEYGYEIGFVEYEQPARRAGKSSYTFASYFDAGLNILINTSRAPLRIAVFCGFTVSGISFVIAVIYFILKLIYWNQFTAGTAPIMIGVFFIGGVQLLFLGILGEYIGEILTRVTKRPLVVERLRINFEENVDEENNADN